MADPYQDALNTLISLGAERALVLQGPAPLTPRLMHGFDQEAPWSDQISLGILERSLQGEPLLLGDVANSDLGGRWSVEVSGIRSVVCVPFWSPSSRILGLLYADTRTMSESFTRATMSAVQTCARHLERALYGGHAPPADVADESPSPRKAPAAPQAGRKLGLKRESSPGPAATRPTPIRLARGSRPKAQSLSVFLRSLTTMVRAGLGLARALDILAHHESDPALREASRQIANELQAGAPLSGAMSRHPLIFQRFDCSLVEVGERSGTLDLVLHELAQFREKMTSAQLRLQSALVYPGLLSLLSLMAVILAPPFVLRGQIEMLRQSGQRLPWLTELLVRASDLFCNGWSGLFLVLVVTALVALLRQKPSWSQALRRRFWRLPVLGRLRLHAGCSRFARGLSLTYKVGIPLPQCLTLATRLADLEELDRDLPDCQRALNDGESTASVLSHARALPPSFVSLVKAGEESGRLDALLEWIARFYEAEFEDNLERLLSLLQPLLIGVMGGLVGLLLLATLLPMVNLVKDL